MPYDTPRAGANARDVTQLCDEDLLREAALFRDALAAVNDAEARIAALLMDARSVQGAKMLARIADHSAAHHSSIMRLRALIDEARRCRLLTERVA